LQNSREWHHPHLSISFHFRPEIATPHLSSVLSWQIWMEHTNWTCNSLVQPYLSYGTILWGNTYSKHLRKLEVLQRKAVYCMSKANYNAHSSPLFKCRGILKLPDKYDHQLSVKAYNFIIGKLPQPLMRMLKRNTNIHTLSTRQVSNEKVRSFVYKCSEKWSTLNKCMMSALNERVFRIKAKKYLINNY